jgi:hypothetical protein
MNLGRPRMNICWLSGRTRYGNRFHIHVMLKRSAAVTEAENVTAESRVKEWIEHNVPTAVIERAMWHGQLRSWSHGGWKNLRGSVRGKQVSWPPSS